MRGEILLILLLMAACSEGGASNAQAQRADPPPAVQGANAIRPADAATSSVNDVIGATPGPCGSTRATAFLGRTYRPEMDAELMRVSGATAVRRVRPTGEDADSGGETMAGRLNVLLNDYGRIIMLDCG